MKEKINQYMSQSPNCVNLGRTIKAYDPALYDDILNVTSFLNHKKKITFNERVYCILNDIITPEIDNFGREARFENIYKGYAYREHTHSRNQVFKEKCRIKEERKQWKENNLVIKKTKLDYFYERNAKRNSHLYSNDLLFVNYDYVICPHTGLKMTMIKKNYITSTLGLTIEEYDTMYPNTKKIAEIRFKNISDGLKKIDEESGLTKHELSTVKAKETLEKVDDKTGLSGYAKKGLKTKATHMANVDELGRNGYSQLASNAIINGNNTKIRKGIITDVRERDEYYRYKTVVSYLTSMHRKTLSKGFITGLAGEEGAHHMDHKYSILRGYQNNISPFVIGNINNLEMLPWEDNLSKSRECSISKETLFEITKYDEVTSFNEFNAVISLIRQDILNKLPPTAANIVAEIKKCRII